MSNRVQDIKQTSGNEPRRSQRHIKAEPERTTSDNPVGDAASQAESNNMQATVHKALPLPSGAKPNSHKGSGKSTSVYVNLISNLV